MNNKDDIVNNKDVNPHGDMTLLKLSESYDITILFSWLNRKAVIKSSFIEIQKPYKNFQVMTFVYKYTIICKYLLFISICLTLI